MTDEAMSPCAGAYRRHDDPKLGRKDQQDYTQIITKLAAFSDTATVEDTGFRCMWSRAASASARINRARFGTAVLFRVTLKRTPSSSTRISFMSLASCRSC